MEQGPLLSAPSSAVASLPPYLTEKPTCRDKAVEFACSACLLCFCGPISIAWCCLVRTPRKIGRHLVEQANRGYGVCCCGLQGRVYFAAYSSFSDMDVEYQNPNNGIHPQIDPVITPL